jgi:hypothetical protein
VTPGHRQALLSPQWRSVEEPTRSTNGAFEPRKKPAA